MILSNTTDELQVVTSTTADIHVIADFADLDDTTKEVTVDTQDTVITTATTTDILASPATGFSRKAKWINIANNHASGSNVVTLQLNRNGTLRIIEKVTLAAGERLSYVESRGVRVFDSEGREKVPSQPRASGAATTAQIASHSADTYYLGMNVAGRLQAGSWFRWTFRANKAGGTATPTYIIRFGTAGTTADTARVTLTGAAQTAVADEAYFIIEAGFRVYSSSAVLVAHHALQHRLATTGFSVTATNVQMTPVASATFDATIANAIIGLSVNPGASGAWVTDLVTLDAVNLLP